MTYTNEQIEEAAKTYEGYGEPVVPAMLRSLIAERKKMVVTDEAVEAACQEFFVGTVRKPWPWRETQDMDDPDAVFNGMHSALDAALKEMQK